jgi:hypothetical protein
MGREEEAFSSDPYILHRYKMMRRHSSLSFMWRVLALWSTRYANLQDGVSMNWRPI